MDPQQNSKCHQIVSFVLLHIAAFNKSHVYLIQDAIDSFTENGIVTIKEKKIVLDLIILATGFDVLQSLFSFQQFGKGGQVFSKDCPRPYLGTTYPGK